jgi:hypothetical protein
VSYICDSLVDEVMILHHIFPVQDLNTLDADWDCDLLPLPSKLADAASTDQIRSPVETSQLDDPLKNVAANPSKATTSTPVVPVAPSAAKDSKGKDSKGKPAPAAGGGGCNCSIM